MKEIDNIIQEAIYNVISESVITEGVLSDIKDILKGYSSHKKKSKKKSKKLRKGVNGRKTYYDYDDYENSHKKISKGDTESLTDTIDQDNTDIAAVADDIFPDHTKTGAQSQLRKILNHERPMSKDVANKLNKMISRGKIAVK